MAGIRVFATGGIGGVHRRVEETLDVSADITELGRTAVAVVCSGAKSILDLPKTMEVLETQGVPVVGYGTNTLPAFYTCDSGLGLDVRVDTPGGARRVACAGEFVVVADGTRGLAIVDVSLVTSYRLSFAHEIEQEGIGDFLRTFPQCRER